MAFMKEKPDRYNIFAGILCIIGLLFVSLEDLIAEANVGLSAGDLYALSVGYFLQCILLR